MNKANVVEEASASSPLRGDLTQGPILRSLVAFSVPALIANILQTIGGSINAIWVAQLLGERAVAATANANMIMFLMVGTVFGFGMATTIRVGQRFGARDLVGARREFGGGIGFAFALSVAISVLGWIYADPVLRLMATPEEARAQALPYLQITFLAMPFSVVGMMVSMGLRGAGDATTPMAGMILTVVVGIVLNPLLIAGYGPFPALGIAGSALAGAIAGIAGVVQMIATLYWRDLPLRLRGGELRFLFPRREELAYLFAKGMPMGAQTLLSTAAGLIMIGLVNREGLLAAAAYGASLQLWNYIQMPAFAVGTAISTMVAQNVGARRHDRVERITWAGMVVALAVTGLLAALILLFDRPVLGLFLGGTESPAVPLARHIQLICTWSFLLMGVMMVLFSTMRAYGAVVAPLAAMFIALYPARLGFYQLTYPALGSEAVWWSYPFGSVIAALLAMAFYRWGGWRKQRETATRAA